MTKVFSFGHLPAVTKVRAQIAGIRMAEQESLSLLRAFTPSQTQRSGIPRLIIGGLLAGLLFVSLGLILLYVPRPSPLQAGAPEQPQQQQAQNPRIHPPAVHPHERDLLSQVTVDLSPFNGSQISSGISLQQVERVYCNFDQVSRYVGGCLVLASLCYSRRSQQQARLSGLLAVLLTVRSFAGRLPPPDC